MVAYATSVSSGWDGRSMVPHVAEDFSRMPREDKTVPIPLSQTNVSYQPPLSSCQGLLNIGVVDSDEEMQPFDAERFVDRLVEDEAPLWRCGGIAADAARLWEAPPITTFSADETPPDALDNQAVRPALGLHPTVPPAAKLFLQPLHAWPEGGRPDAMTLAGNARDPIEAPIVVPPDPIMDALFTPARITSPEIPPAVTLGLVRVPPLERGRSSHSVGCHIKGFEPATIYNIAPPTSSSFYEERQVPWAPLRPAGCGGAFRLPSPGAKFLLESARRNHEKLHCTQRQGQHQQVEYQPNTYAEASTPAAPGTVSGNSFCAGPASEAITPTLTGADAFTEEYDDDQHAFLREQELSVCVGSGYLAGPGKAGLITVHQREALVDWLSKLHAAAPAASGGGPPLSPEALFLAVNLMDRFLSTPDGPRVVLGCGRGLKVAAAACLGLASKYEDTQPTSLWGLAVVASSGEGERAFPGADNKLCGVDLGLSIGSEDVHAARKEVAAMELTVASALGFRLTVPTALSFLGMFVRRAFSLGYLPKGSTSERVRDEAQRILLRVLRDASSLEHPPSALAAAALYWASCVTAPGAAAPASFAFFAVTGYQLDRLCRCLRDMELVRTGGGSGGGGGRDGRDGLGVGWAGAAFPEHAGRTLFGAGGGHPAIAGF